MIKNTDFESVVYVGIAPASLNKVWNEQEIKPWPVVLAPATEGVVDLTDIMEGVVIEKAAVHVLATVTGATQLDVGDNSAPDNLVAAAALNADTDGGVAAVGVRYSAENKAKLTVTGQATAGLIAVVIKGYRI